MLPPFPQPQAGLLEFQEPFSIQGDCRDKYLGKKLPGMLSAAFSKKHPLFPKLQS